MAAEYKISEEQLEANFQILGKKYLGRMEISGLDVTGTKIVQISHIAGRSPGSRNRIYDYVEGSDGSEVTTAILDPEGEKGKGDPDKTLYVTQASVDNVHIASNGKQTIEIAKDLARMISFEDAHARFGNEEEINDFTARIHVANFTGSRVAIFGRISRDPLYFPDSMYESYRVNLRPGYGFFIATYDGEGGLEPSVTVPLAIALPGKTLDENLDRIWEKLDKDNRVGLVGREIDINTGRFQFAPFRLARTRADVLKEKQAAA